LALLLLLLLKSQKARHLAHAKRVRYPLLEGPLVLLNNRPARGCVGLATLQACCCGVGCNMLQRLECRRGKRLKEEQLQHNSDGNKQQQR
jgi:hypothetical protein